MWFVVSVLALVSGSGGVNKPSGIEQFWTDDYKIFEQVYGKTSDKQIYGSSLPPAITIGTTRHEASDKKEKYLQSFDLDADTSDNIDLDSYKSLLNKPSKKKPATSSLKFISYSDFKPISQSSDPETYNYLRHLEEQNEKSKAQYPKGVGGFKPYLNHEVDPEETEAYKSIQDILDAHEANKGTQKPNEDNVKYLTYSKSKKKKPSKVRSTYQKPRCSGRCRKRGAGYVRGRGRPYVRRVKHRVVNY